MKANVNIGNPISLKDAHIAALKNNYVVTAEKEVTEPDVTENINTIMENGEQQPQGVVELPETEVQQIEVVPQVNNTTVPEQPEEENVTQAVSPLDQSIDNANTMDLAPIIDEAQKIAATESPIAPSMPTNINADQPSIDVNNDQSQEIVDLAQPTEEAVQTTDTVVPTEPVVAEEVTPTVEQTVYQEENANVQPETKFGGLDELNRLQEKYNQQSEEIKKTIDEMKQTMASLNEILSIAVNNANRNVNDVSQNSIQDVQQTEVVPTMTNDNAIQFPGVEEQNQGPVLEKVA